MKTTDDKRILAAIQPDPEPQPVACHVDHSNMATGDCPKCGAFQDAAPSSAGTVSVEAAARVLMICDGCGCTTTDAELSAMREVRRSLTSCCPERKMRSATRADWDALRALAGEGWR